MLFRSRNCLYLCLFLAALVSGPAFGQTSDARAAYLSQIAELQRTGDAIAQKEGKDALIQRYRALIDANPGYANNIQLETQIGLIYESDLSDRGEPPDMQAAYATYQGIIETYDPSSPYMKTVRRMAAQRAMDLYPDAAQEQYWSMLEDYPTDDPLVMESYFNLGRLAEKSGDMEEARRLYEEVLNHVPVSDSLSQAERATADAFEANAALCLMAEAIRNEKTAEGRVAAIQAFLERYPDLAYTQGDLVERLLKTVEDTGSEEDGRDDLKQAIQTLVNLLGEKRSEEAAMDPAVRALRRQHRRQVAQADGARRNGKGTTRSSGARPSASNQEASGGQTAAETGSSNASVPSSGTSEAQGAKGGGRRWVWPVAIGVGMLVVLVALRRRMR